MDETVVRDKFMKILNFEDINTSVERLISQGFLLEDDRNIARFILHMLVNGLETARKQVEYDDEWLDNLSKNGFLSDKYSTAKIITVNTDDNEDEEIMKRQSALYSILAAKDHLCIDNGVLKPTETFEKKVKKQKNAQE